MTKNASEFRGLHEFSGEYYVETFLVTLFRLYLPMIYEQKELKNKKICSKTILLSGQLKK